MLSETSFSPLNQNERFLRYLIVANVIRALMLHKDRIPVPGWFCITDRLGFGYGNTQHELWVKGNYTKIIK